MSADRQRPALDLVALVRKGTLQRYLLRRVRTLQDAEDLAQEVYLRLLKLEDPALIREPVAYMFGIAARVVAESAEGFERRQAAIDDEVFNRMVENGEEAVTPDVAGNLDLQLDLQRALATLPANQAEALELHEVAGLSYVEVADRLGIKCDTVRKYLVKAKVRLRTLLWRNVE